MAASPAVQREHPRLTRPRALAEDAAVVEGGQHDPWRRYPVECRAPLIQRLRSSVGTSGRSLLTRPWCRRMIFERRICRTADRKERGAPSASASGLVTTVKVRV